MPGDLLSAVKNQGVDSLCLQRQPTGDYLLTLAHPEQKQKVLFQGTIYHKNVAYWFDDPDKRVTFVNIFGAPFELSDVVLQAHLRKYGTILAARRGKYHSHTEVENGIRHLRMILRKNIPTTLHVGPLQISVKYEGQPHTCNKCGEQGHSAVTCRHIRCFGCGEIGHRQAQCDRPNICLFCGGVTHTSNTCPGAYPSFGRRTPPPGPKVPPTPTPCSRTPSPSTAPKPPRSQSPPIPPKRSRTTTATETSQPPTTSAEASDSRGGPSLQDLLKGVFGTMVEQRPPPPPCETETDGPTPEVTLGDSGYSVDPPQKIWGAAGLTADEYLESVPDEPPLPSAL